MQSITKIKDSRRTYNIVGYENGEVIQEMGVSLYTILSDDLELFYSLLEFHGIDSLLSLYIDEYLIFKSTRDISAVSSVLITRIS